MNLKQLIDSKKSCGQDHKSFHRRKHREPVQVAMAPASQRIVKCTKKSGGREWSVLPGDRPMDGPQGLKTNSTIDGKNRGPALRLQSIVWQTGKP